MRLTNGERRRERQDVRRVAFRQQDETVVQQSFGHADGDVGGGRAVVVEQLEREHQANAPRLAAPAAKPFGQAPEFIEKQSAHLGAALGQLARVEFAQGRYRHRAANRVAEERAGVDRLAGGLRPGAIHHIGTPNAGRERKAAGERFAEA